MTSNFGRFTNLQDLRRQDQIFQQMLNGRVGRTFQFSPSETETELFNPVYDIDSFVSLQPQNASAAMTNWYLTDSSAGRFSIVLINPDFSENPVWTGIIIGQK